MSRRIVLYSHDAMGIGHIRRNLRIARALRAAQQGENGACVLLISGVAEGTWYPLPEGVDFLALPSLRKEDNGRYTPRRLSSVTSDHLVEIRARTIAAAVESFQPDCFIVDKVPRGVANELVPALATLRSHMRTRCVLGLRDILDEPEVVRREWAAGHYDQWIRNHYDAIWIYGDPGVYDTVRRYDFSPATARLAQYTGYLEQIESASDAADPLVGIVAPGTRVILCTCGGGEDGAPLARAFARAQFPPGRVGVILTGPFMPAADREHLRQVAAARNDLRVIDFSPDPLPLLRRSERVVLMGGYNSVTEVLRTDVPALVVPRVLPRAEQLIRAEILAASGMIDLMLPDAATPRAIGSWLASPPHAVAARREIDFGGLDRIPRLLDDLLARRGQAAAVETSVHVRTGAPYVSR